MSTIIQVKRTTTANLPSTLEQGELAYIYDTSATDTDAGGNGGRLYIGDPTTNTNTPLKIGGKYYTDMMDHVQGTLTADAAILVDANKAVDELFIGNSTTIGGTIKFNEGTNNGSNFIGLKAPNTVSSNVTFTLPGSDGSVNHYLKTDGSGNLSFAAIPSGSFDLSADTGTDSFTTGETLTFAGGTSINTSVSSNTVTFDLAAIDADTTTISNLEVDNLKSGVLDTDLTSVSASDDTLASAKAIKTYVDSQVTAQDLDFQGDTGGALNIDLDSETFTIAGGTGLETAGASNTLTISISNSGVDTTQLADNAVTTAKITNGDVTNAKLANSSITFAGDSGSDSASLGETLTIAGDTGITTTATSNTITVDLDDTTVTAGSYGSSTQIPTFTVDQQGRLTAASTASISTTLDIAADSGTDDGVALGSDTLTISGGTGIDTSVSGDTITVAIDSTVATLNGTQTLTNKTLTNPDINGGSFDGGTIGATSAVTEIQVDNININGNEISSTNTNGNISLSPDGTGSIDVNGSKIIALGTPTVGTDAATKAYVDTIAAAGIHYHDPVRVESPTNLNATYNNGTDGVGATLTNAGTQAAITIDGVALSLSDRVLIYAQTNAAHNGVYTVTTVGSGASNWVLTRSTDTDSYGASDPDAFGQGDAFFVKEGDTGAGELYVMNTEGAITFGTTNITFTQVAETAVYNAGAALSLTGTTFSVDVDDSTIEISSDALQIKDLGVDTAQLADSSVTNAKLAGSIANSKLVNSTFSISDDSATTDDIALGETLSIVGGEGIDTVMTSNTLTISGEDASTSNKGIALFSSNNFAVSSGTVTVTTVDGGTF